MIICTPPHLKNRPQIDRGSDVKGIVKDLAWNLRPGEVKEMMLYVVTEMMNMEWWIKTKK